MRPNCDIAVIVCIGSVSAKHYQVLRLKHFKNGQKVKIVRIDDDLRSSYEDEFIKESDFDEDDFSDYPEETDDALIEFFKKHLPKGEVVEVIANEKEWNGDEPEDHLFSGYYSLYWKNLRHVTIVTEDGRFLNA
jgi:hypothetical protein